MAAFDAAAGEPDREAPVVVVAAHAGLAVDHLDGRRPAELAAAEDQRLLEKPALLEVGQECRDRPGRIPGRACDGSPAMWSWLSQGWTSP